MNKKPENADEIIAYIKQAMSTAYKIEWFHTMDGRDINLMGPQSVGKPQTIVLQLDEGAYRPEEMIEHLKALRKHNAELHEMIERHTKVLNDCVQDV